LPKKLSDTQKEEIIKGFMSGKNLDRLSEEFSCTKLTISRNLKKKFGDEEYKKFLKRNLSFVNYNEKVKDSNEKIDDKVISEKTNKKLVEQDKSKLFEDNNFLQSSSFTEIVPLNLNIDNENRKELTSIPIDEIDFPNIVFMIIDKNTELEIKQLKDYPEWDFLPEDDLRYKTIEIYSDLKDAKRNCRKEQKVMKVSNPNVFKVAAKMMLAKGISRIISDKLLIAL
tara:strand:+ start:17 stop:694 length:678 start_codon:yes stop_codon:yes gene_type:complete